MEQMHSAAIEKSAVTVNSKKPVNESTSKTDRPKKVKNVQTGMDK